MSDEVNCGQCGALTDNATSAATSVQITAILDGFGVGQYIGSPASNSFTLLGGTLIDFVFISYGSSNSLPDVTCCTLMFFGSPLPRAALFDDPHSNALGAEVPFASDFSFTRVVETPLPAALPLFATGLGALGLLGWRRKRKATISLTKPMT